MPSFPTKEEIDAEERYWRDGGLLRNATKFLKRAFRVNG